MAEEKKKSWFKRHWILTIILVLVILAIIGGAFNSDSLSSSSKSSGLKLVGNEGSDISTSSNTKSNDYSCPILSTMKLQDYNSLFQSWTAEVFPYKSGNIEIIYDYTSEIGGDTIIYCDIGSEEGQNSNYVYCGDFLRPIKAQYIDSNDNIIKKRSVEVIFDKNTKQYLSTKCDTYDLY